MTDVIAGRFALCDPIARGGSGVVWRAFDRRTGQFCAAKLLRRREAGDLLRFVREQSVRLHHPNVVTPYSWAAEDAHVVIASELVDGGSLATLINDYGPLAEGTVAMVLGQLLLALEHVHGAGLVHRDVKPANLLLQATGSGPIQVRLADFGLAMGTTDAHLTQLGTVVGTPGYMPPEIRIASVAPDVRHDLYAAGRVAGALVAGAEPTDTGSPIDLSRLPPGPLLDVIGSLTCAVPGGRPGSARHALELLRPVPVDPLPLTADGDPVEVLHQLPPLTAEALAELGPSPTAELVAPAPGSRATGSEPAAPHPSRLRRLVRPRPGALVVAGITAVLVAVGVPVGVALTSGSGSGSGSSPSPGTDSSSSPAPVSRSASSTPGTSPTTGAGGSNATSALVSVGDPCTFVDEGNRVTARAGTAVVCRRHGDGKYVWDRA